MTIFVFRFQNNDCSYECRISTKNAISFIDFIETYFCESEIWLCCLLILYQCAR